MKSTMTELLLHRPIHPVNYRCFSVCNIFTLSMSSFTIRFIHRNTVTIIHSDSIPHNT